MRQEKSGGENKTVQKSEDDFLDKDAKPDERKFLLAAKPFFVAVANRKYADDAHALLSGHARTRMSLDQTQDGFAVANLIRRAGFPACRAALAKQGCLADKTGWKPVLRRERSVDARQHLFFPEHFEQMIQTGSHSAASRRQPCGVNDCAEFYA